jgi:hypothetical protein
MENLGTMSCCSAASRVTHSYGNRVRYSGGRDTNSGTVEPLLEALGVGIRVVQENVAPKLCPDAA